MENQDSTSFGTRLKWARKKAKLTQIAAAKKIGMSQGTLAELENEGKGSSYTAALAALYGVDSYWLATGKGEPHRKEGQPQLVAKQDSEVVTAAEIIELAEAYVKLSKARRTIIMESTKAAAALVDRGERSPAEQ
jgi:transcriptional regulator with XRE-family HTH domain